METITVSEKVIIELVLPMRRTCSLLFECCIVRKCIDTFRSKMQLLEITKAEINLNVNSG